MNLKEVFSYNSKLYKKVLKKAVNAKSDKY